MREGNYWTNIARRQLSRRRLLASAAAGGAGVAGAALIGCGDDDDDDDGGAQATATGAAGATKGQPVRGGVLKMPMTFDSNLGNLGKVVDLSFIVGGLVHNQLIQEDPYNGHKLTGDLAASWEQAPDGLTYTFKLRDAKWHDGKPVTAEDIAFSIERMTKPQTGAPGIMAAGLRPIDRIETPDPKTVVLKLKEPSASLLATLAHLYLKMLPKHQPSGEVGSGAFRVKEHTPNVRWTLERNPDYYVQGRPYLDSVEIHAIPTESEILNALQVGQIDMTATGLATSKTTNDRIKSMGDAQQVVFPGGRWYFTMNNKPPFNDERVRKAISMGIDRQAYIQLAFQGGQGQLGTANIPKEAGGQWGFTQDETKQKTHYGKADVKAAREQLQQAGLNPGSINFEIIVNTLYQNEAPVLVELLKPLGINATVKVMENAAWFQAATTGNFEMTSGSTLGVPDDPSDFIATFYLTGAPRNYGKWSNPEVDKLYQEQDRILNFDERKKKVQELDLKVIDWSVWPILAWRHYSYAAKNYLKNMPPLRTIYSNVYKFDQVWIDKK